MKYFFSLTLFVILTSCTTNNTSESELRESLEKSLSEFNEAFKTGDLEVLDAMTTEDYTHTNGNSMAFGKESWFNYLRRRTTQLEEGSLSVTNYQLLDVNIVMHSNSAIVNGRVIVSGQRDGAEFANEFRVSNFWVNQEGAWKRAGFHDTKIK